VETRGESHVREIISALEERGFAVTVLSDTEHQV
jgi:Holliday junction resolvase